MFYFTIFYAILGICTIILGLLLLWIVFFVYKNEYQKWEWTFDWVWFDMWIGCYFDVNNKVIYFCPFPMLMFKGTLIDKNKRSIE